MRYYKETIEQIKTTITNKLLYIIIKQLQYLDDCLLPKNVNTQ